MNYKEMLKKLLISEYDKTEEQADKLIKDNYEIVMRGNMSLHGVAMLLDEIYVKNH